MVLAALTTQGVNPARAGMIRLVRVVCTFVRSKPRASGDDPTGCGEDLFAGG